MKKEWITYDPEWLIELAKQQIPERHEIIEALNECTKAKAESRAYIYFVNGENSSQPDSKWRVVENIILNDKKKGPIILDVLEGNKIGGAEFMKYI